MTRTAAVPVLDRRSAVLRTGLVVVATLAALPFTFATLLQDYRYGAPLGELVVVPLAATAVALVAARRHPWVAHLRPGRADGAVAVAAFTAAAGLLVVLPVVLGNAYFTVRPDLLAVPLVAAGAVSLLLGVRALVAFLPALAVALLAWPLPVRALLDAGAGAVTAVTSAALQAVLQVLPLATVVPAPGDLRLAVDGPGAPFEVLVASACSGGTGIAGSLLVGLAAQYVLRGTLRRRLGWLLALAVLSWTANLLRLVLLLGVGRLAGERAALDLLHPVAGLLLLNAGFALALLAAPRFGLAVSLGRQSPVDSPLAAPAAPGQAMGVVAQCRRVVAVAVAAAVLAVLNTTLPASASSAGPGGAPTPVLSGSPLQLPGHAVGDPEPMRWAQRYFGEDSSWTRYRLATLGEPSLSVWADTITTPSWAALRAHPVLDCYRFHGYDVVHRASTVLPRGLLADEVVYRSQDGGTWHVLTWEWPVRLDSGLGHQRVTLLASSLRTDLPGPELQARPDLRSTVAALAADGDDPNPALTRALRGTARAVLGSPA